MRDVYETTTNAEQAEVRTMLATFDAMDWLDFEVPRVERVGLRIAFANGGGR